MAGCHITLAGLVTLTQYGINTIQPTISILVLRNRTRLEFHFRAVGQFNRF